jgi:4-nitrophenyl phosphatase
MTKQEVRQRLSDIKYFALDMDGTLYLGDELFSFTIDFLNGLKRKGREFIFLTNNSSKSAAEYQTKLRGLGIDVDLDRIYTSGTATIEYFKKMKGRANLYLLGTEGLHREFQEAGFETLSDHPDYVLVGFDQTLTFEKLDKACRFIRDGVPFIATHPDLNCPLPNGDMLPDCGAITAAITASTKIKPKVIGKPNKEMIDGVLRRLHTTRKHLAFVGDRLMTDIQMGRDSDILSILILTGEATLQDLHDSTVQPDLVFQKTIDIIEYL